jgi:small neutral amino acid transporter SnatA (MarC family)
MKTIIKIVFTLLLILVNPLLQAQDVIEMADSMRADGKIYVVVAILSLIFIGLIAFLISIDRKVSRLEKRFPTKKG